MIGKEETEARILRIARIHGAVVSGPNRGEAYGSMIRVHHATLASMDEAAPVAQRERSGR